MKKFLSVLALAAVMLVGFATLASRAGAQGAQDPGITPNGAIGEVVAVDANAKQIFVRTDAGSVVVVAIADSTIFKKIPPGETSLGKAVDVKITDLSAGDRVFARGAVSDDRKTVMARMVIVNTKAELEQKREAERAEWRRRGIVGSVASLNPETKEITLTTTTPEGPKPIVIAAGGADVKFRRYAPDSVKFSDAKPSTFAELKVGDQLRAKGEKSADGARFTPEEVVSGTFRTSVGTVTAVDVAKNELTIKPMQGNETLTVVISRDAILKQVPENVMAMMGGGAPGAGGPPPAGQGGERRVVVQGGTPPDGARAPAAGGQQGGERRTMMGGPGGFDPQRMLEMLPATTVAEIKPGSMIVVSSTVGADPSRLTAIQLVAGVEPLLAMMQRRMGGPGAAGGMGMPSGGGGGAGMPSFGFGIGTP